MAKCLSTRDSGCMSYAVHINTAVPGPGERKNNAVRGRFERRRITHVPLYTESITNPQKNRMRFARPSAVDCGWLCGIRFDGAIDGLLEAESYESKGVFSKSYFHYGIGWKLT